MLYKPKAV